MVCFFQQYEEYRGVAPSSIVHCPSSFIHPSSIIRHGGVEIFNDHYSRRYSEEKWSLDLPNTEAASRPADIRVRPDSMGNGNAQQGLMSSKVSLRRWCRFVYLLACLCPRELSLSRILSLLKRNDNCSFSPDVVKGSMR